MSKVYVEITDNYSRTVWDSAGTFDYVIGDRVEHNSGSQNIIFVCLKDNNSTQTPDANISDWVKAGSEEYPFLVSNAISANNQCNLDDTTLTLGEYALNATTTNFAVEAAGSEGEIILGDGEYRWSRTRSANYWHPNFYNTNIKAKNRFKAYIRGKFTQYNNCARAEDLVFVNEDPAGSVFGKNSSTPSYLIGCLITQETPSFKLAPLKQEPNTGTVASRAIELLAPNSVISKCLFDFSYSGPSFWFNINTTGVLIEGNTFYARVKNIQYEGLFEAVDTVFKNNIIYYKYLKDEQTAINFSRKTIVNGENNVLYVENPISSSGGSLNNNIPNQFKLLDPLFIDADNGNFSLRPSSPLIGGLSNQGKQSEVENQYPQGKWFDSNAAAGGDGSWETPYNNYGEAINSFTGDEAVILVKEGEHPLYAGFWNGSTWGTSNDLTKVYSSGVKIIGMGKDSTFTAGSGVSGWPTFYSSSDSGAHNPNLIDTPFLLKDFTILLTSPAPYNRSLWTLRKGTMINVHVKPKGPGLGNSGANLFDYNMSSATGDYLHMSSCTIEVTFDTGNGNFCEAAGQKQFSNCTFIDPNHTRSSTTYPKEFLGNAAGNVAGSFIKDCIFYTKSPGFNNTGASNTLCQLSNTVFYSTQDELTLSSGTNKTNCAIVDPRFVNDNGYEAMDLRLRADSPLIGGITKHPSASTSIWYVNLIDGDDTNDGKTPDTAMLTISAAHAASIHLDTIFIVNENILVSSDLDFPGGRKYESLTKCTIDFNDNYSSSISAAAGLDTYIKGFDFIKMRGGSSLLSISSDVNSLFVIEGCKFEGILTDNQSAPIGGNGITTRSARQGSIIKGCTFDIGWTTQTTGGSTSCGFIAVDRTDIVGCTFWVKDSTPLGSTNIYLVGTGGQGAWSHGPPLGPVEVKNCIVHGNNRMHYGIGSGDGGNLGFTSNTRVTPSNANYVIHHCCLYGINGTPMDINNTGSSEQRYYMGSVVNDRSIPLEWIENIFIEDPKLVDPGGGNFTLKADSPLIGQGK